MLVTSGPVFGRGITDGSVVIGCKDSAQRDKMAYRRKAEKEIGP